MQKQIGITKTIVRLRKGPGLKHEIVAVLGPGRQVELLSKAGLWLQVKYQGKTGFVGHYYIIPDGTSSQPQEESPAFDPYKVPLQPAPEHRISIPPDASFPERLVSQVWNKYGGLLSALSKNLAIDPGIGTSVFAVESGGRGFGLDGRLLIRFETHIFYDYWGKNNLSRFGKQFRFDEEQRWMGHQFRRSGAEGWKDVHIRSQKREWEAFEFASQFSTTAARLSISMGAPQIMGFNYSLLGFQSVHEMFDAFSKGEREQIIAFFNFITGRDNRRLEALQRKDFLGFAKYYNGTGQSQKYGRMIREIFETFHSLQE